MATLEAIVNGLGIVYGASGIENGDPDMADKEWQDRVKGILKAELKRRNLSYADLSAKLAEIGVRETELNIKNKISRGGFSAVFFVQALVAIGAREIRLD